MKTDVKHEVNSEYALNVTRPRNAVANSAAFNDLD